MFYEIAHFKSKTKEFPITVVYNRSYTYSSLIRKKSTQKPEVKGGT